MPIPHPHRVDLASLVGIDGAKEELLRNTEQFVSGRGANHVLLWGERGTGKSSCVKGLLPVFGPRGLRIVELARWDLFAFPKIVGQLRDLPFRFLLYCDDLSFDEGEADFRGLKTLLDGGVEERPENVLIYATSNRRHLMPERRLEFGAEDEIHPEEAVSEKLSLSDRFGLQLGFYRFDQATYLAVVESYARRMRLPVESGGRFGRRRCSGRSPPAPAAAGRRSSSSTTSPAASGSDRPDLTQSLCPSGVFPPAGRLWYVVMVARRWSSPITAVVPTADDSYPTPVGREFFLPGVTYDRSGGFLG